MSGFAEFLESLFIDPAAEDTDGFNHCVVAATLNGSTVMAALSDCSVRSTSFFAASATQSAPRLQSDNEGKLAEDGYGWVQLLFLMAAYGYILFTGANLIGDGAELLLLVPSMAGVVGTLVLPILGAVPDGAMVLFSGLGPTAQEQLSVGMGALAGSTIMLLTIPWFLAILAGRVDVEDGECTYSGKERKGFRKGKLTAGRGLSESGVSPGPAVPTSSRVMLITCLSYLIIQLPANFSGNSKLMPTNDCHGDHSDCHVKNESDFALAGLICTLVLFVGVCAYQVYNGSMDESAAKDARENRVKRKAIETGLVTFRGAFLKELEELRSASPPTLAVSRTIIAGCVLPRVPARSCEQDASHHDALMPKLAHEQLQIKTFLRPYFNRYDMDSNGEMDVRELRLLFQDLGEIGLVNDGALKQIIVRRTIIPGTWAAFSKDSSNDRADRRSTTRTTAAASRSTSSAR